VATNVDGRRFRGVVAELGWEVGVFGVTESAEAYMLGASLDAGACGGGRFCCGHSVFVLAGGEREDGDEQPASTRDLGC